MTQPRLLRTRQASENTNKEADRSSYSGFVQTARLARTVTMSRGRMFQVWKSFLNSHLAHAYMYGLDNPINLIDPSGLQNVDPRRAESKEPNRLPEKEIIRGKFARGYEIQVAIVQPGFSSITALTGHGALVIKDLRTGEQLAVSWGGDYWQVDLIHRYLAHGRDVLVYTYKLSEAEGKAIWARAEWVKKEQIRPCTTAVYESLRGAGSFRQAEPWYSSMFVWRRDPVGLGIFLDMMHSKGFTYVSRKYYHSFHTK